MPVERLPASRARHLVAGLDLGSTSLKMLVSDDTGAEIITHQVPTPWRSGAAGTAEMTDADLTNAVRRLITITSQGLERLSSEPIRSIAISGMGETGLLMDRECFPVAPAFAWFDPRGAQQANSFPPDIRSQFAGRTGLPLGAQVTVSKLAYLRDQGLRLDGLRWLNLPEFVAMSLGGQVALEHSLISRTGLIDQDTGQPWPEMLGILGVGEGFLPDRVDAGSSFGRARADLPANLAGSQLTVAGHDHLVAAMASDALTSDHYHVSMGTAEVLLRVSDAPLGFETRSRLASNLINEVQHVVPGKHVLVAGLKTGLLLRRVLQVVGVSDRAGRDRLDDALMALPYEGALAPGGIDVGGARNDEGDLRLTVRTDGVSPAELFAAVLRHSNDEIGRLIRTLDGVLPPARSSTLTGGWASMRSVQRARSRVLPGMTVSTREQETAYGAARTAARLLDVTPDAA